MHVNPAPAANPDFDYKDLETMGTHWTKIKGRKGPDGKLQGNCTIHFVDKSKFYGNFVDGKANGQNCVFKGFTYVSAESPTNQSEKTGGHGASRQKKSPKRRQKFPFTIKGVWKDNVF